MFNQLVQFWLWISLVLGLSCLFTTLFTKLTMKRANSLHQFKNWIVLKNKQKTSFLTIWSTFDGDFVNFQSIASNESLSRKTITFWTVVNLKKSKKEKFENNSKLTLEKSSPRSWDCSNSHSSARFFLEIQAELEKRADFS